MIRNETPKDAIMDFFKWFAFAPSSEIIRFWLSALIPNKTTRKNKVADIRKMILSDKMKNE